MVLAVTIAISTVNPLLLEYAIDVNIAQKDWRGLVALCVFMVVINLVYAAGVRLRMLLMARITNNILLEIRDELYTHIQTLSFSFLRYPPGRKDSGAHHRRCQLVKGCAERRCHKADSEHSHDHRHSGDHDDQKHLALLKCDSRAAADRCRHVFYSDRRTQEMADVPEKILPMLRHISTRTSPVSASSRALPQSRNRRASLTGFFLSIRTPSSMRSAWRMVFPL